MIDVRRSFLGRKIASEIGGIGDCWGEGQPTQFIFIFIISLFFFFFSCALEFIFMTTNNNCVIFSGPRSPVVLYHVNFQFSLIGGLTTTMTVSCVARPLEPLSLLPSRLAPIIAPPVAVGPVVRPLLFTRSLEQMLILILLPILLLQNLCSPSFSFIYIYYVLTERQTRTISSLILLNSL
jgi:hypothetical protein